MLRPLIGLLTASVIILALPSCKTMDKEKASEASILDTKLKIAINYLNRGEPERAHHELRRLRKTYPDNADVTNLYGLAYLALKQYNQALILFRKAYKQEKKPAVALNISSALIELGKVGPAVRFLKKARRVHADYKFPERFKHNIGYAYHRAGKLRLARKYYEKALADNPANYISIMQLGDLYEQQKQVKVAAETFRQAQRTCQLCYDPVKRLSMNYVNNGQYLEAVRTIEAYLQHRELPADRRQLAKNLLATIQTPKRASRKPTRKP